MAKNSTEPKSFEAALAALEEVVQQLEDGTTGLDDALAAYERGIGLLKSCYDQLRQAEQRIVKLTGTDADGQPLLEPFQHSAAVEAERTDPPRRRSRSAERD